jgi:hypothetical protein
MNQNLLAVVSSPTSFSKRSTMSIDSALQAQTQNLFVNPLFLAVSSLMLSTPRSSSAPPSPFALQALTQFLICQPSFPVVSSLTSSTAPSSNAPPSQSTLPSRPWASCASTRPSRNGCCLLESCGSCCPCCFSMTQPLRRRRPEARK